MKKYLTFATCTLLCVVLFSACNKVEDDYYFPKMKLASAVNASGDGLQIRYDGKFISTMKDGDDEWTVRYNADNQISEMATRNDDAQMILTYDHRRISRIDFYQDGNLYSYRIFKYDYDGKIATVSTYGVSASALWKCVCAHPLLARLFDVEPIKEVLRDSGKGDLPLTQTEHWTYSGNNVKTVSSSTESEGVTVVKVKSYSYDKQTSPFFGLPYTVAGTAAYSANNAVKYVSSMTIQQLDYSKVDEYFINYTYGKNKYPLSATIFKNGTSDENLFFEYAK